MQLEFLKGVETELGKLVVHDGQGRGAIVDPRTSRESGVSESVEWHISDSTPATERSTSSSPSLDLDKVLLDLVLGHLGDLG